MQRVIFSAFARVTGMTIGSRQISSTRFWNEELYIYAREVYVSHGRGRHTVRGYFFSAGAEGPVLTLTLENLKKTFPDNQRFHDALDAAFGARQSSRNMTNLRKCSRSISC